MHSTIELYLSSGQTQKEFCQSQMLSKAKFSYWLKKIRSEKSPAPGFMPLQLEKAKTVGDCRIELPNGINIILTDQGNGELVHSLISQSLNEHASCQ